VWSCFVRRPGGDYLLRYAGVGDFVVAADVRTAVVHLMKGSDPARIPVFVAGALPAFVLMLQCRLVLHASAISPTAAGHDLRGPLRHGQVDHRRPVLCRRRLADHRRRAPGRPRWDTPLLSRLRGAALAPPLGRDCGAFAITATSRPTRDGREALRPAAGPTDLLPLVAIVIPAVDREAEHPALRRLEPIDALLALSAVPRLFGWREPRSQAAHFQLLADLCHRVPVQVARAMAAGRHVPGVPAQLRRLRR
jgi:hypothetical protein